MTDTSTQPATIDSELARHSFLYAGEWQNNSLDDQVMYVVRDGRITWSHHLDHGEYGDATLLPSGNVIFSTQFGAREVTPEHVEVWRFDAPTGAEVHTCQPIDDHRVFIVVNATPARALIVDRRDGSVVSELVVPTAGHNPHTMFRHCRYTADGTYLMAHMDADKVTEYDATGVPIWTVDAAEPWAAVRLDGGTTLISGNSHGYLREVDRSGRTVWEFNRDDAERHGLTLGIVQQAQRLDTGNTVFANWNAGPAASDRRTVDLGTVQLVEVTPDKTIAWALHAWDDPDLGPASAFHLLDQGPYNRQQR